VAAIRDALAAAAPGGPDDDAGELAPIDTLPSTFPRGSSWRLLPVNLRAWYYTWLPQSEGCQDEEFWLLRMDLLRFRDRRDPHRGRELEADSPAERALLADLADYLRPGREHWGVRDA
jgi:hypothetical protein